MSKRKTIVPTAGNIKVCIRLRPFLPREHGEICCVQMPNDTQVVVDGGDVMVDKRHFDYDRVYWSHDSSNPRCATQQTLMDELGQAILDNAMDGFNNTLFAYGQTGSGKTHSVLGEYDPPENRGLLPRILQDLFRRVGEQKSEAVEFQCHVSYLEIYNEQIRDLLIPMTEKPPKLTVRHHPKLGIYVAGLTTNAVTSYSDVQSILDFGTKARSVAATNMNSASSRSHCIFNFTLLKREGSHEQRSERQKKTGASGSQLKEGAMINQSLSNLALVINKLASSSDEGKADFVPFRNSKLTHILQDALSGNSKTVMIAAISPALSNYEETLGTLKFAQTCKHVATQAVRNEASSGSIVEDLTAEIARLKEMLEAQSDSRQQQRVSDTDQLKQQLQDAEQLREKMEKEHSGPKPVERIDRNRAMPATISVRPDGVGVITLDSPPVNSLGTELVTSFKQEFPKLVQDPKVKAIVVTGKGAMFCGGAEISEFAVMVAMGPEKMKENNPVAALSEMMDMIDASPKTTVAALNGPALGGGGEVSLACHYRVAAPNSSVGFPEVNLGLLPGGQGTQRLPRVAPLPTAMQMILQGKPLKADAAKKNGIVDLVASGDLLAEAAEFALSHPPAPISKREVPKTNRFMVAAGALESGLNTAVKAAPLMVAPRSIIKCFEAACSKKSFREGLQVEMEEFTKLVFSVESAALRHLFLAERMAQKVPGVDEKPAPLKKIGILGAGLMGGGIAMCFVQKGIPVVLKDAQQDWLDSGMKKIESLWAGQLKKGRLSKDKYQQYMGLLKPTLDYADFKDVDMVIEAVPEIMDLKKQVFLDIEKNTKPDALICTNTSGLNIDDIAAVLKDPSRVMGTHFFSPANVMQLLENVRTSKSSIRTLSTGMAMGKLISKKCIMVGNCDGFVGNRMLAPYAGEAKMLLE
ncbi:unnamed protein product, partial [Effrenium voratum]